MAAWKKPAALCLLYLAFIHTTSANGSLAFPPAAVRSPVAAAGDLSYLSHNLAAVKFAVDVDMTMMQLTTLEGLSKSTSAITGTKFRLMVTDNINIVAYNPDLLYWSICEIMFLDGSGNEIATHGSGQVYTASPGHVRTGYFIENAFDGDIYSAYTTANGSHPSRPFESWLQIEFPSAVTVAQVKMKPQYDFNGPSDFVLQFSTDGVNWSDTSLKETAFTWTDYGERKQYGWFAYANTSLWATWALLAPPTPSPTTSPTLVQPTASAQPDLGSSSGGVSAAGDPHLQNIHGQQFDLMRPGKHVLLHIPKGAMPDAILLGVMAEAQQVGVRCADMYFQEINITGAWAEIQQVGGFEFRASDGNCNGISKLMKFADLDLKVVYGCTSEKLRYLNFYVKHLDRAGLPIGGLLGEDDHTAEASPTQDCDRHSSLMYSRAERTPERRSMGMLPKS